MTADRLALATRVMKARRSSICTICRAPVLVGQPIARLIRPPGWCHLACVPAVAAALRRADSSNASGNFCFEVTLGYRRCERPGVTEVST